MLSAANTAYPLVRSSYTPQQLERDYTPSKSELEWIRSQDGEKTLQVALLTLLKTAQVLGRFELLSAFPREMWRYFAKTLGYTGALKTLSGYDRSGSRHRHLKLLRTRLDIQPLNEAGRTLMVLSSREAAAVREDLLDLVQRQLEELVRARYELPPFSVLLKVAQVSRNEVNAELHAAVVALFSLEQRQALERLWTVDRDVQSTPWNRLRSEPGKLSRATVDAAIARYHWMKDTLPSFQLDDALSQVKREQFAQEAKVLHAGQIRVLGEAKRLALGAVLVVERRVQLHDDLATLLVRAVSKLHTNARETLSLEQPRRLEQAGVLIKTLKRVVTAYGADGTPEHRFEGIRTTLEGKEQQLLEACEIFEHADIEASLPYLKKHYPSRRKLLLDLLETLPVEWVRPSPLQALRTLVLEQRSCKEAQVWVNGPGQPVLQLAWVPKAWHRLIWGEAQAEDCPLKLEVRVLELITLSAVTHDLLSGAAFVPGGRDYGDWRALLVSEEHAQAQQARYLEQTGLPSTLEGMRQALKADLHRDVQGFDGKLERAESTGAEWRTGEIVLKGLDRRVPPEKVKWLEAEISQRLPPTPLLDSLSDSAQAIGWTRRFGHPSGADRLDNPLQRYLTTVFSYGCNVGASQTARAFSGVDRRDIAWIDNQHIPERALERASAEVIRAYNKFALPKYWGSGKGVVADGTKWAIYEDNLLAEYHVRYGGYGGIAYHHVADNYIALFSHFIPCGVWEAVYILDGMLKQSSDLEPDTLHADTQGQSLPVFALAYLLGIRLMPRIRNWKDLTLYRASSAQKLRRLDRVVSKTIDWKLIEQHLPEMLRLVISIKEGRVLPSTILKRLNSYSHQNPFYAALLELGKVQRTLFLLRYLGDLEVRRTVLYTTNKVEQYNAFTKWVSFGGEGRLLENHRDRQRKRIQYMHLVSNCLIWHNVYQLTEVLKALEAEGHPVPTECLPFINPYMTRHINRLGVYTLDLERQVPEPDYGYRPGGSESP